MVSQGYSYHCRLFLPDSEAHRSEFAASAKCKAIESTFNTVQCEDVHCGKQNLGKLESSLANPLGYAIVLVRVTLLAEAMPECQEHMLQALPHLGMSISPYSVGAPILTAVCRRQVFADANGWISKHARCHHFSPCRKSQRELNAGDKRLCEQCPKAYSLNDRHD
jgi:hypothetical protein